MTTRKNKTANRKAVVKTQPSEHPIFDAVRQETGVNPFVHWSKSILITKRPEYKEAEIHDISTARAARQPQS